MFPGNWLFFRTPQGNPLLKVATDVVISGTLEVNMLTFPKSRLYFSTPGNSFEGIDLASAAEN